MAHAIDRRPGARSGGRGEVSEDGGVCRGKRVLARRPDQAAPRLRDGSDGAAGPGEDVRGAERRCRFAPSTLSSAPLRPAGAGRGLTQTEKASRGAGCRWPSSGQSLHCPNPADGQLVRIDSFIISFACFRQTQGALSSDSPVLTLWKKPCPGGRHNPRDRPPPAITATTGRMRWPWPVPLAKTPLTLASVPEDM